MFNSNYYCMVNRIAASVDDGISREEALSLVPRTPKAAMEMIACANLLRQQFKPHRVFRCAILNAKSGHCSQDCAFCSQSVHHNCRVETYPLRCADELIEAGLRLASGGATHYSVVTSGVGLNEREVDTVCRAAETLRKQSRLHLCASVGMLSESSARRLKAAGVTRYHHNLETAPSFFNQICTTHDYQEDIDSLRTARAAGLEICSGGIFGMGESWGQRVEMFFMLKQLDVDCIPVNFLNPLPGTRLAHRPLLPALEALSVVALLRFIHPGKDITICGGREITLKELHSWVLFAGANGLMIGNYLTTQGRNMGADMQMLRTLSMGEGERSEDGMFCL
ncbi:MAG: biotin synthase BioB [Desulfatitalea sp.]|nr:biotin synthase BioB [Desulfatitalea sp.]